MVNIEQSSLRTLEQQVLAIAVRMVKRPRHISDHRRKLSSQRQCLVMGLVEVYRLGLEIMLQHEIVEMQNFTKLFLKLSRDVKILEPYRAPRHLVFVSRPYAAAGRADFFGAFRGLAGLIDGDMVSQYQRAGVADLEPGTDINSNRLEFRYFLQQRGR